MPRETRINKRRQQIKLLAWRSASCWLAAAQQQMAIIEKIMKANENVASCGENGGKQYGGENAT